MTYLPNTEGGVPYTSGLSGGVISGYGKSSLNLIDDPDFEWLMIDASHCKVHSHAAGAKGGNQGMGRTKGGSTVKYIWPWMRMVCCRSELLLQQVPQRIARKQRFD